MPHNVDLILMLAGALGAALALGLVTQRLGLSPIVGYLLAGVVVGPFTPGFVADTHLAEQSAELGVVLLMFGVGLHFHLKDLLAVWRVAVPGALIQSAVATALGVLIARWFGWSLGAGIVFGLSISVASTVVLVRVLSDHDALHTPSGHVAVGWLVVEDLFTVVALVMLPVVAGSGVGGEGSVGLALGKAALGILAVVALAWAIGRFAAPRFLSYVARTRSRELFTLAVLVLALGIAAGSSVVFGVSMALGAFLAGMVVGESEFSLRAASEALPMRDPFAVLFFVSVGMLVNPGELWDNAGLIAATVAVVVAGKAGAAFAVVRLLRYPVTTALAVAVALAQIGEFSFMLASLGREAGVLPPVASQVLVATSIVSITLNPLLYRLLPRLVRGSVEKHDGAASALPAGPARGAIVVGYGPVGRAVTRILRDNSVRTTVIELNHDAVRELQAAGQPAVHGDASQASILEHAGVRHVATLIFAASGTPPRAIIETARELNPSLRILARSAYAREVSEALGAGANVVVCGEVEVALAMAEVVLSELGATGENLDRARHRTRDDLAATPRA